MFNRIFSFLYGDDIFISYSRADGATYAASLANQLARRKFSFRIDQWGTQSIREMPKPLKDALQRSRVLVLIGTPTATKSIHVADEIAEFKKTRGMIIPIVFDGVLLANEMLCQNGALVQISTGQNDPEVFPEEARWANEIEGLPISCEKFQALQTGIPTREFVKRIVNTFNFSRKDERLRKASQGAAAVLAVLIGLSLFFGYRASVARQEAEKQTALAAKKVEEIEAARLKVQELNSTVETKTKEAEDAQDEAKAQTKIAKDKTVEAITATELAENANREAQKATSEASRANNLAIEKTNLANEKTQLAVIASAKAETETKRAGEATARATESEKREIISKSNLASNYFATGQTIKVSNPMEALVWMQKAVNTSPDSDERLENYIFGTRNILRSIPKLVIRPQGGIRYGNAFSLSPLDDKAVNLSNAGKINVWNLKTGEQFPNPLTSYNCVVMGNAIFSPDGQWLAALTQEVITVNNKYRTIHRVRIWNAETGIETKESFDSKFVVENIRLHPYEFTPDGKALVFFGNGADGKKSLQVLNLDTGKFLTIADFNPLVPPRSFSTDEKRIPFPIGHHLDSDWIITFRKEGGKSIAEVLNLHTGEIELPLPPVRLIDFVDFVRDSGRVVMVYRDDENSPKTIQTWDVKNPALVSPPAKFGIEQMGQYSNYTIRGAYKDNKTLFVTADISMGIPRIDRWDVENQKFITGIDYAAPKEDLSIYYNNDGKTRIIEGIISGRRFIEIAGRRIYKYINPISDEERVIVMKNLPYYVRTSRDSISVYNYSEKVVKEKADSAKVISTDYQFEIKLSRSDKVLRYNDQEYENTNQICQYFVCTRT